MTKRLTTDEFIEKARKIHGDTYDYSLVNYKNMLTDVEIICRKHGIFKQNPNNHIRGKSGCPRCFGKTKHTTSSFVELARKTHGSLYDYSESKYINYDTKLKIICKKHGPFYQTPNNHISGNGCPVCAGKNISTSDFILRAKEIHGDLYDYSKTRYRNNYTPVIIICKQHGEFNQLPGNHIHKIHKMGCPSCGIAERSNKRRSALEDIINRANIIHGEKYDYSQLVYTTAKTPVTIVCPQHGSFKQTMDIHLRGSGCPRCAHHRSNAEKEICTLLDGLGVNYKINSRDIIDGAELDIFCYEQNVAIEYNGLYWHSEMMGKHKDYHLSKYIKCKEKGIKLLTVFEDEWLYKKDILERRIAHAVSNSSKKIFARKCSVSEITASASNKFLDNNHIQGRDRASVRLGLFYGSDMIGVMNFSKTRFSKKYEYEMTRFCTSIHVVGGMSKLFKSFVAEYNPSSVVSYADLRYGDGSSYANMGFVLLHQSPPNYWYMRNYRFRESRVKYQKHKLVDLNAYDPSLTEWDIMKLSGYDRIWDCGNNVWVWENKT